MRVTVCELPSDPARLAEEWSGLVGHCRAEGTDVLLLPEMPFSPWLAFTREVDPTAWDDAIESHGAWERRLTETGVSTVLSTRPTVIDGHRHNQAFVWADGDVEPGHLKYYLPDEEGFWEATWYERGDGVFAAASSAVGPIGFLICTEVWFTEHARGYAREGVRLLATPRATERATRDRWLAAGRVASVMAGAFGVSSNRVGTDRNGAQWGGLGWVIDPSGTVLASTSEQTPWVTVEIDLDEADRAKSTYPRYVTE